MPLRCMNFPSIKAGCLVLAASLAAVSACSGDEPYEKETFVMGTRASVKIYGLSTEDAGLAAAEALRELHRVESVMSNWRERSEVSVLNRESRGRTHEASRELLGLVDSSIHYSRITLGAFDITARPLVRLWGFQGGASRLPSGGEIAGALLRVGSNRISIDTAACTITLPRGTELDLAGIAKGYGIDRSVSILRELGVRNALVDLGGNIYALGAPPGRRAWTVGIRDPRGSTGIAGTIGLRDEAVATSGNYENFVEIGGTRYGHIMDPRSGRPVEGVLSVTVIASTALAADALSTALFVLGPSRGSEILEGIPGVRALFATPDTDGSGIRYTKAGGIDEILVLEE